MTHVYATRRVGAIRCDCKLFEWYPDFAASLLAIPGAALASCANDTAFQVVNPAQVKLNPFAPCTQVVPLLESNAVSSRNITLHWQDPSIQDAIPASAMTQSLANFKSLDNTVLDALEAAQRFRDCEQLISPTLDPVHIFGYKITFSQDGISVLERCGFAQQFGYTTGSTPDSILSVTIDGLQPASTYEVTIAALNVTANIPAALEELLFTLGPVISPFSITTAADLPEGNITQIRATTREDQRISLEWADPPSPNGVIEQYEVELIGESRVETSSIASISLDRLGADAAYSIRIRAATSAGFGEWSPPFDVSTCPENLKSTNTTGACFAERGFFLDEAEASPRNCLEFIGLIELGDCERENLRVNELSALPGVWRSGSGSIDFRQCPLGVSSCAGGSLVALNSTLCQPNYEGPLCAICADGYFYNGVQCEACDAPSLTSFAPLITSLGVLIVAVVVATVIATRYTQLLKTVGRLALKFKVLITTYQIVGTFSWTLGAVFPSVYTSVVNVLLFLNFDVTDLFPSVDCIYASNYLVELILVTGIPLCAAIIPIVTYWRSKTSASKELANARKVQTRSIQALILISFLVYTPVSSKIFRALRPCDQFPDLGVSYMPEDYRIACGGAEHTAVLIVAYTMLFVYCFGVPVFYTFLLWPKRRDIQKLCRLTHLKEKRSIKEETELEQLETELEDVSFLFNSYWYWWWELIEVLRKLMLAGMITLIAPGTAEQSIVLMMLAWQYSVISSFLTVKR